MRLKITSGDNIWLIAGESQVQADGNYQGRLLNELKLSQSLNALGSAPVTLNISVRNDDGYISSAIDLWGATVEITTDSSANWTGTITAYDSDGDGNTYLVVTEKAAPELAIQMPDEVARLVTVDNKWHSSAVNVTLPLVFGGNSTKPHLIKGILIDKTAGIYLLCVGEIHQVVKVYRGTEEITTGFTAYTGTAGQANFAGFAYVQITDEALRKNDDGSYAEISADVIGLKLGSSTIEECRNGARVLYYLLTTAKDGVCSWGLGIGTSEINTTAFNQAMSDVDTAGLKFDGIFYFRQAAQSWIDQICLAIRGAYSIGRDGKRALYINKSAASAKTYAETNMRMLRHGVGAYTGRVYNKGKLDFDYNPITGQFMQSAQYEDAVSVAAIGEQEFYGQSYLIKDMATAQAIVEYTCKKSLIGARKVYFETDELPTDARNGTVITVTRPDLGITGDYQITSLEIGDHVHTIEAEKYDTSIFSYGTPGTAIDWTKDPPIVSAVHPGAASGLSLATDVEYDSAGDGTATPFIAGTFTTPEGKYLGAAVFWGEGETPSSWETVTIKGTEFKIKPVRAGQLYTVKIQMFNQSGTSAAITGAIVAGSHTALPPTPTIAISTGLGCIIVNIAMAAFTAFSHFEIQRQKSDGSGLTTVTSNYRGTAFTDDDPVLIADYENLYQYRVRAVSRSGTESAWTAFTASVSATQVRNKDVSADQFIGKHFTTALDVGEAVDGVRFTAAGIEMWQDGIRKVLIPVSGDPDFEGVIKALAGLIGGWKIAEGYLQGGNIRLDSTGAVQTVDFVSGNKGWKADGVGDAEFNNIRARGAIKTVVFEKNEISVVGGRTLIRPAGVVSVYNYAAYIQAKAQAHFDAAWAILCELIGVTEAAPDITVASYAEYLALDQAYYRDIAMAMGFATYETGIDPAAYDDTAMQAYLLACWATMNSILGTTHDVPTFPAMTQAAFAAMEAGYWNLAAEIADNPPAFTAVIGANDCRVTLDDAEQFNIGDVVRMKDGLSGDYWGVISGISGNDVDIAFASGELFAITAGQTIVNYGPVNSGGVLLDGQAPMIDVYTHGGEPWNGTDIKVRIGNLKGWGTINHDVFGIAIGDPAGEYLIYDDQSKQLQLTGSINIVSARGIGNFSDAGALAGKDDIDLSYVTDAGTLAGVDDLDGVGDGATYKKTTANEKSGAGRAYSGLDTNNRLITAVIPATNIGTPAAAGLFLGKDYLGFYNAGWKTYMDNAGNFALIGGGTHGLSWNAETGVLTIAGSISILGGSGYGNLTDRPTNLAGINATEGSKLTGIEAGADVTSSHTSADTTNVAGTASATVRDNAANALANAATAQSTATTALNNAATANNLLADIAADNKLTPVEKQAARKEWDIIATEQPNNSAHAMNIMGFSTGIAESGFSEAASDSYWSQCWTKLNALLGESNAEPAFPAQTYASFVAEESLYYSMVKPVIDSETVTVPPTPNVLTLNTAYIAAFQALANYLNAGSVWSSGVPSWISDANISAPTDIAGATFRATWKTYYDAKTALLNAIAAKAKILADLAQGVADTVSLRVESTLDNDNRVTTAVIPKTAVAPTGAGLFLGANYLGYHDGSDWKTYMDDKGNFALDGTGAHGLAWDATTGTLTVAGNITVQNGSITADKVDTSIVKTTELQVYGKNRCPDPAFDGVPFSTSYASYAISSTVNVGVGSWIFTMDAGTSGHVYTVHKLSTSNPVAGYSDTAGSNAVCPAPDAGATIRAYSPRFKIKASTPYITSASLKAVVGSPTCRIRVYWYDSVGAFISYVENATVIAPTSAPIRYALAVAAPSTASYAAMSVVCISPSGAVSQTSIAAVQFEEGSTVTAWVNREQGTVTADRIVAGQMKSLNYSTTAGSLFDLDAGDLKLGGSSAPKFSFTSSTSICVLAGFTIDADDLTAGSSTTAIGISTDTAKKAFWAGSTTPASAPFFINHNGTGKVGGFAIGTNYLESAYIVDANNNSDFTLWAVNSVSNTPGITMSREVSGYYSETVMTVNYYGAGLMAAISVTLPESGEYGFWTNGKVNAGGGYTNTSDARLKKNISDVTVLDKLRRVPVKQYNLDEEKIARQKYEREIEKNILLRGAVVSDHALSPGPIKYHPETSYIGAMAAEFNAAFGVNDASIDTVCINDQIGVALRAIQELAEIVDELKSENTELRAALNLPEKLKKQTASAEFTAEEIEVVADKHVKAAYENILKEIKP